MRKTKQDHEAKNTESERKALERRQAENEREQRILDALPDSLSFTRLHAYPLYGALGSVTIGENDTRYGQETDKVSMAELAELLDQFPPLPITKTGSRFAPSDYTDKRDRESSKREDVWGVVYKVDGIRGQGECHKAQWWADVNGVRIIFTAVIADEDRPIRRTYTVRELKGYTVCENAKIVRQERSSLPNFWIDQRIRWAAGSNEHPQTFTLYWLAIDDSLGAGHTWYETILAVNRPACAE